MMSTPNTPGKIDREVELVNDDIDCAAFLAEIGMSQYAETFLVNMSIDSKILKRSRLSQVRQKDLSKMGITNFVHQKVLMEHIQHVLKFSFHSPVRKKELKTKVLSYTDKTGLAMAPPKFDIDNAEVAKFDSKPVSATQQQPKKPISTRRRRSFDTNVWQSISNLRTKAAAQQQAADNLREGIIANTAPKANTAREKTRRRSFDADRYRGGDDDGNATASSLHDKAVQYGNMAQEYDIMLNDLKTLQNEHVQRFKNAVNCEVATIMFINSRTRELLMFADNNTWYRFPMGSGLAGYCAETGHTLNISNAYLDHRFNRNMDIRTGFKTRNILCQPLRNMRGGGQIVGVIEAVNKRNDEEFDQQDEEQLASCVEQIANDLSQRFRELLLSAEKFTGNAVFIGEKNGSALQPRPTYSAATNSSAKRTDSGKQERVDSATARAEEKGAK